MTQHQLPAPKPPVALLPSHTESTRLRAIRRAITSVLSREAPDDFERDLFALILRAWRQDRPHFLAALRDGFPHEYRIIECYMMTGKIDEYPDGEDAIYVLAGRYDEWWFREGWKHEAARAQEFDECMALIGNEVVVFDDDGGTPPWGDDDSERFGDLPKID